MALSQSERNKKYRSDPIKRARCYASASAWSANNKDKRNAYMRAWWTKAKAAQPEKYFELGRRARLKRRYGITPDDYDLLLTNQNGHCALCERTPDQERYGYLHVDHCHDSNKIRGLLCEQHNLALGKMGDTEEALRRALNYIKGI